MALSAVVGAVSCLTLFYPTDLRGVAAGAAAGATITPLYVLLGWVVGGGHPDALPLAAALAGAAGGAVWRTAAGVRFPLWGAMIAGALLVTALQVLQSRSR